MAAYVPSSHSPRVLEMGPVTPLHSPQHSVNSSVSSRTPLHTLTLHEYRKQQNSPASHVSTPSGKTLRRKAAAPALNEVERVSASRAPLHPLHLSHSASQLNSYRPFPPTPPHFYQQYGVPAQPFRSQSAEPYNQGVTTPRGITSNSTRKIRNFKPIKRLPKPNTNGPGFALSATTLPRVSPLRTTSFPSNEAPNPSDTQTTPSTLSLSRFPQPPHLVGPSHSPPNAKYESVRAKTTSFVSTAPATPPATPAVIHYRGTSFDLVNPHDSLVLHDIVTPSKDLDSTDYLPLRSSDDSALFSEMAPKRALYGDLTSAYASIITRRTDEYPDTVNSELPLPPVPAALSPESSLYTTPVHSPDSHASISPLALRNPDNESRFSLKQLTRSLTKKLGKTPESIDSAELEELSGSRINLASATFDGEFPRSLNQSYHAVTPKPIASLDDLSAPALPLEYAVDPISKNPSNFSVEYARFFTQDYSSAPLTSMVPDDPQTQFGGGPDLPSSVSDDIMHSKPYYDDLASIYPSSSVYTGDDRTYSNYTLSLSSDRKSNPFSRLRDGADALANEYKSDALYDYSRSRYTSRRVSRPLTQEIFQRSIQRQANVTDTISKFIDQYKRVDSTDTPQPVISQIDTDSASRTMSTLGPYEHPSAMKQNDASRVTSGLSQFDFGLQQTIDDTHNDGPITPLIGNERIIRPEVTNEQSGPPSIPMPLAPAFEYDNIYQMPGRADPSDMFSGCSSYGDTRQLLQLSQPVIGDTISVQALQPSSSYPQRDTPSDSHTPQEAIEIAETIFETAVSKHQHRDIPAIWARRSSGGLLRSKSEMDNAASRGLTEPMNLFTGDDEEDIGDWETVGNGSNADQVSPGESIADYSSSEGSRDSLEISSSLPVFQEDEPVEPGSFQYKHPTPLGAHIHPFSSSPPPIGTHAGVRSGPNDDFASSPASSPSILPRAPTSLARYGANGHNDGAPQPTFTPVHWVNQYVLSDKETQELLASGPNDEILYENALKPAQERSYEEHQRPGSQPNPSISIRAEPPTSSSLGVEYGNHGFERENTFDKFSVLGPKGNITGTPQGTGMHEAGSSEADNSSPGAVLTSSPCDPYSSSGIKRIGPVYRYSTSKRISSVRPGIPSFISPTPSSSISSDEPSFYAVPGRKTSVHRVAIRPAMPAPSRELYERTPSQTTLFPQSFRKSLSSPSNQLSGRQSLRSSSTYPPRRHSRAAVPGQTKLRQMVLAPDAQTLSSDHSTHISCLIGTADEKRPSTSHTHTPLRTNVSEVTLRTVVAYEHSPHLLCPERAIDPEEEAERRKLSWIIFAVFCILPPMLLLYRWMADFFITNITKGRILHVSPKPKRIALSVGIVANIVVSSAILLPILIAHAHGSL